MPAEVARNKLAYQAQVFIQTSNVPIADIRTILQRLQALAHSDATITALTTGAGKSFTMLFDNIHTYTT